MKALRIHRITFGFTSIALIVLVWHYSERVPVLRAPDSPWIPLAISPDGETLAVADFRLNKKWWTHSPGGPIRLLRTADLAPTGPLIETPTIELGDKSLYPRLHAVEFSPDGKLLAVLQNGDMQDDDMLELLLLRLPEGEVWKSFPLPYDRWNKRGGIARNLFSRDGRLLAWQELSKEEVRRDIVRVWDVTEGRERFKVDDATYPVLSPDGKILAGVEGKTCRLYDTQTGMVVRSLPVTGHLYWQPWAEFSLDGQFLAICSYSPKGYRHVSVIVFEVSSGQTVFTAEEWSPFFLEDSTLASVKGDSVVLRDTNTWEVRGRARFALGQDGNGMPISPDPVPGTSAILVFEPAMQNLLGRIGRTLRLNLGIGDRVSWIDAGSGSETQFTVEKLGLTRAKLVAPRGKQLVLQAGGDITIWELPPARSWVPTIVTAILLVSVWAVWTVVRRRAALPNGKMSLGRREKGSA